MEAVFYGPVYAYESEEVLDSGVCCGELGDVVAGSESAYPRRDLRVRTSHRPPSPRPSRQTQIPRTDPRTLVRKDHQLAQSVRRQRTNQGGQVTYHTAQVSCLRLQVVPELPDLVRTLGRQTRLVAARHDHTL